MWDVNTTTTVMTDPEAGHALTSTFVVSVLFLPFSNVNMDALRGYRASMSG